jgi:mycofactocin system glycosyltransferase
LNRKQNPSDTKLEYRLRSSVQYKILPDGKAILILAYPLKVVYINPFWKPVLDCFTSMKYIALENLAENITEKLPEIGAQQIELFLNDLTRKGFFEQRGFAFLKKEDLPFVSIIIPVRNRPEEISACLKSLEEVDYPKKKLEIIVVDDASQDNTPEMIQKFPQVRPIFLTEHSQASLCRNQGAKAAKGDILAFIDSDCLADPSWLRELVPAFRDQTLGGLGGLVDSYFHEKSLDKYEEVKSALKISSWFKRSKKEELFFYLPFCNFLVRRKLFIKLKGLKEELHVGEDVDFCWRLQDSNSFLEYRPMGRVFHKHRNNPLAFCIRRFDYGTSEPLLQKLHPKRRKKIFLPPHETLFWAFLFLSLFFKSIILFTLCPGILAWDTINRQAKINKRKLPISFFTICKSSIRSYFTFIHHCTSFVSRYYLIPGFLLAPLLPKVFGVIFCMHLAAGVVEYCLKKPPLNPITFLFFFSLEQISYQAGVLWGCFQHGNAQPILPKVVHRRNRI